MDKQSFDQLANVFSLSENFFTDIVNAFDQDVFICDYFPIDCHNISAKNILILIADHLGCDEYLLTPKHLLPTTAVEQILSMVSANPTKRFFVATYAPFAHEFFNELDNLKIIHWGDFAFLSTVTKNYHQLNPVSEKKFEESWHWVCFNHNVRMHRNICMMLLLGADILNGHLRFDPIQLIDNDSWQTFLYYLKVNNYDYLQQTSAEIYPILERGFNRVKMLDGYVATQYSSNYVWEVGKNTKSLATAATFKNFDKNLRKFYLHSTVDIINETVFINRTGIITEKYLNSIIGYNFPIILSMQGTVAHLRSLGFDMFDDVIDHAYDNMSDHYSRMMTAILSNKKILQNRQLAIESWMRCEHRFDHNLELMRQLIQNRETHAKSKILQVIE